MPLLRSPSPLHPHVFHQLTRHQSPRSLRDVSPSFHASRSALHPPHPIPSRTTSLPHGPDTRLNPSPHSSVPRRSTTVCGDAFRTSALLWPLLAQDLHPEALVLGVCAGKVAVGDAAAGLVVAFVEELLPVAHLGQVGVEMGICDLRDWMMLDGESLAGAFEVRATHESVMRKKVLPRVIGDNGTNDLRTST